MMKLRHGQGSYQPIPIISGFLNKDGSDSLAETIEAIYKREAGDPRPCRQRDRANQKRC